MSAQLHRAAWAWQFYFLQSYSGIVFAVFCRTFWGDAVGQGALLGTVVYGLAQALFIRMAFRHRGAQQARRMAGAFYFGECTKFLMLAGFGWLGVVCFAPPMLPFVLAWVVLQSAYFWVPLCLKA